MNEDLNGLLARACRTAATEQPSHTVDDIVLRAARWHLVWRRRRQLIPLAMAAGLALALVGGSNLRRHEMVQPVAQPVALDPIAADLLRIRSHIAAASALDDFLLNSHAELAFAADDSAAAPAMEEARHDH